MKKVGRRPVQAAGHLEAGRPKPALRETITPLSLLAPAGPELGWGERQELRWDLLSLPANLALQAPGDPQGALFLPKTRGHDRPVASFPAHK